MKTAFILALGLLFHFQISAQILYNYTESDSSRIDGLKLGIIAGVTLGAFTYIHAIQNHIWWKGEKSKFHFEWNNDWKYSLGADKVGHFFFSYAIADIYYQTLKYSGIGHKDSRLYSTILSAAYQTYTEIKDGFSKKWGFSWGDLGANTLGTLYPLLQDQCDFLQNVNFKISFEKSQRFEAGSHNYVFDDYESTYHWMTINLSNLFSDEYQNFFTRFINLSIGHSVKGLDNSESANHEFFVGIDWNIESLPGDSDILKLLKSIFNKYHLPAPAVKVYPGIIWYGLKF
jgi:hypothetical protein